MTVTFPFTIDRLQGIQQQIQQHLVDLIAVVLDFGQGRILLQCDLDGFRQRLLACQHDRMLHRVFRSLLRTLGRMRPRRLQQIGDDVVDAGDFLANVFHHRARRDWWTADRGQ